MRNFGMADFGGIRRVKLTPPLPPSDAVRRPALMARLDRAAGLPLVTVTAPAGFGKTTLLASWARSGRRRAAWLSLDAADGDLRRFAAYLAAAIRTVEPAAVPSMDALLGGRRDLDAAAIAAMLADDLVGLEADLTVILDDLHAVHDDAPAALLDALLRYPPPRFHLVILSREQPAGPNLRRLWSRGLALTLDDADLRFGRDEIAAVLGRGRAGEAAAVEASTEGWPAGVRAVALAGHAADQAGSAREVRSYLIEDALAGQSPETVALLRATAVADRLCPDLAAALGGDGWSPSAAQAALGRLVEQRLFTTRIDSEWIRVHPVLRDAMLADLAEQAGPAAVMAQHRRASAWFAASDMAAEAVDHALNAGSAAEAAALLEEHALTWLRRDDFARWSGFIDRLPDAILASHPGLLLVRAHALLLRGYIGELPAIADAAERLLDASAAAGAPHPGESGLRIEIGGIRCLAAFHMGDPRPVLPLAERLLDLDVASHPLALYPAVIAWSNGMAMTGRGEEALARLAPGAASGTRPPDQRTALCAIGCFILSSALGDARGALGWAETALYYADPRLTRPRFKAAAAHLGALFELGDRARAEEALAVARAVDRTYNFLAVNAMLMMEAQFRAEQGRFDEAHAALREARRIADLGGFRPMLDWCDAQEASVALAAGEIGAAGGWADRAEPHWQPMMPHQAEPPPIILARVLAARGTPADLDRAVRELEIAISHGREFHDALPVARALPILAVVRAAQGDDAAAMAAMEDALDPSLGPAARRFTTLGDPARDLVRRIAAGHGGRSAEARRVLSWWPPERTIPPDPPVMASPPPRDPASAIARLSNRELDVLRLLAQRRSNKEIAAELNIAPDTVKEYTVSLYRKLGVRGRHAAADMLRSAAHFA